MYKGDTMDGRRQMTEAKMKESRKGEGEERRGRGQLKNERKMGSWTF